MAVNDVYANIVREGSASRWCIPTALEEDAAQRWDVLPETEKKDLELLYQQLIGTVHDCIKLKRPESAY
jgi:hypothetical protein